MQDKRVEHVLHHKISAHIIRTPLLSLGIGDFM